MTSKGNENVVAKEKLGKRMLAFIEEKFNKLWDPITLFCVLCLFILVLSMILSLAGVTAVHPGTGATLEVVNLLSKSGLQMFVSTITSSFQSFPPLGLVIIVMMGVGLADKAGLMTTFLRRSVSGASRTLVTAIVVFLGINAVAAGDAGFVVLPPLAAVVFLGMGRHPLAGLYAAYASVASGFAACLFVQMGDVIATSFTIPAAQLIDPSYTATPAMNLYFMAASAVVLLPVGVWVNNRIVEPRLGEYVRPDDVRVEDQGITELERKGLRWAGITLLVSVVVMIALCIGPNAFFADPETGALTGGNAPLMKGIVPIVTVLFLLPGLAFGIAAGTIRSDRDAVRMMSESVSELGGYIVLAFFASQFMTLFAKSNLGAIISIKGAESLQAAGISGIPLLVGLILLCCFINLFLGSAGAKWAILAPIFVPMFMLLGYDPALTQACYRVGDSLTNTLTPLFSYFPILLGFIRKYQKDAGLGTVLANMLPYSLAFGVVWVVLLIVFVVFNIPVGIGGGIYW